MQDPFQRLRPFQFGVAAIAGAARYAWNNRQHLHNLAKAEVVRQTAQLRRAQRAHQRLHSLGLVNNSGEGQYRPWKDKESSSSSSRSSSTKTSSSDPPPSSSSSQGGGSSNNRMKRYGYRKRYLKRRKRRSVATERSCFKTSTTYGFNIFTGTGDTTATGFRGRIAYSVPIDTSAVAYVIKNTGTAVLKGPNAVTVANAATCYRPEPFTRLRKMYDWYRVTGIKIRFDPVNTNEIDNATQVQNVFGLWNSIDYEDPLNTPAFVQDTAAGAVGSLTDAASNYEKALASRKLAKKMPIHTSWERYFKIPLSRQMSRASSGDGGQCGQWLPCDGDYTTTNTYGHIYLEQPFHLHTASAGMANGIDGADTTNYPGGIGRITVTKYFCLKDMNYAAGQAVITGEVAINEAD